MERTPTPPAFEQPPYYVGLSQCDGVYGGEEHWAVLADDCRGIIADVEGGLTLKAKARADFIVRACNAHEQLLAAARHALDYVRSVGCGDDQPERIEELESAITSAHGNAA